MACVTHVNGYYGAYQDLSTMTLRMLYELKGDVLRLCYDLVPDAARPEEFAARDSCVILTLKREQRPGR